MTDIYRFGLFLAFLTVASAALVQFHPCEGFEGPPNCVVHQVDIDPCREAESGEPCRIKKGKSAAITFDYTPEISSRDLQSKAYWLGAMGTLPWIGMESDACGFTNCPITAGERYTYNYTLNVSKTYAARVYKIQWRLWDTEEQMNCCFTTRIRLV